MTCDRYRELLSARLDGELTDFEEREISSHIEECPGCRQNWTVIKTQQEMLSICRVPGKPKTLRMRIKRQIGTTGEHYRMISYLSAIPERSVQKTADEPLRGRTIGPWGRV